MSVRRVALVLALLVPSTALVVSLVSGPGAAPSSKAVVIPAGAAPADPTAVPVPVGASDVPFEEILVPGKATPVGPELRPASGKPLVRPTSFVTVPTRAKSVAADAMLPVDAAGMAAAASGPQGLGTPVPLRALVGA
jgi:hypothetical protein